MMAAMADTTAVADLTLEDLLARIAGGTVTPGAGAAGAVALALAAACAGKAVSVTLKHRPDEARLLSAEAAFQAIARDALTEADRDSAAFGAFVHEGSAATADRLVREGERFAQLIAALTAAIDEVADSIQCNMAGDIVAARALAAAARRIQQRNEGEALNVR